MVLLSCWPEKVESCGSIASVILSDHSLPVGAAGGAPSSEREPRVDGGSLRWRRPPVESLWSLASAAARFLSEVSSAPSGSVGLYCSFAQASSHVTSGCGEKPGQSSG